MKLLGPLQLQAMLYPAQELVGLRQFVKVFAADVSLIVQFLQRKERATRTQPSFFAAINPLQTLRKKLDIANAAAIELHVNGCRLFADGKQATPVRSHFLARKNRRLNRFKIDVPGIDVRFNATNKLARQRHIAGRVSHLDERLQLPIVCYMRVVIQRMLQTNRRFAFTALWTQTQINAKDCTFTRGPRKHLSEKLCLADEIFAQRERACGILIAVYIKEVNIGTIVQLISTQLDQREHGKRSFHQPAATVL